MTVAEALFAVVAGAAIVAFGVGYLWVRERVAKWNNIIGRIFNKGWVRKWDIAGTAIVIVIGALGFLRGLASLVTHAF